MVRIERMADITDPVVEWPATQRDLLKERLLFRIHRELIKDVESALELVDNQVHDICEAEGMDQSEFLSSGGIDPDVIPWFRAGVMRLHREGHTGKITEKCISRAEKAAITAEAVRNAKAEKPEATQQQIADEVGISRQRTGEILSADEKDNLSNSPASETIEQEAVRRNLSEMCVKRERQLQRDHPETFDQFKAGEFKSLNAACIEAGIVQRKVGVPVNDVAAVATILLKHYTKHELIEAIQLSPRTD